MLGLPVYLDFGETAVFESFNQYQIHIVQVMADNFPGIHLSVGFFDQSGLTGGGNDGGFGTRLLVLPAIFSFVVDIKGMKMMFYGAYPESPLF